jgi:hypothetical protein
LKPEVDDEAHDATVRLLRGEERGHSENVLEGVPLQVRAHRSGIRVYGLELPGCRGLGLGSRIQGSEFRVEALVFRVRIQG